MIKIYTCLADSPHPDVFNLSWFELEYVGP